MKSKKLSAQASKTVDSLTNKNEGFQTVSQMMKANAQNIRILISKGVIDVVNPEGTNRFYYHLSNGAMAEGDINGLTKYFNGICMDENFNVLALSEPHRPAHFLFSDEQREAFLGVPKEDLYCLSSGGEFDLLVFRTPQGEIVVYNTKFRSERSTIQRAPKTGLTYIVNHDGSYSLRSVYSNEELNHINRLYPKNESFYNDLVERNFPVHTTDLGGEWLKPNQGKYDYCLGSARKQDKYLYNIRTGESMEFLPESRMLRGFPSDREVFENVLENGMPIQEYVAKVCKDLGVYHYVVKHRIYEVAEKLEKIGSEWAIEKVEQFVSKVVLSSLFTDSTKDLIKGILSGNNLLIKETINKFVKTKIS